LFIASPSDVEGERQAVRTAVDGLNATQGRTVNIRVQADGFENVGPGVGRPQELINPLIEECDIFVGILNRRWGNPTGTHSGGFEEEFELALNLARRSGSPKVWLFLKEIPDDIARDPGPELTRMLDFRRRIGSEKTLLYKPFKDAPAFALEFFRTLSGHVITLAWASRAVNVHSEGETAGSGGEPEDDQTASDPARAQIVESLEGYASFLRRLRSIELDKDRLLLFSLAVSKEADLPVHAALRLYAKRSELRIVVAEQELLLRTFVGDVARNNGSRQGCVIPGWYFLRGGEIDQQDADILMGLMASLPQTHATGVWHILRQCGTRVSQLLPSLDLLDDPVATATAASHWNIAATAGSDEARVGYLLSVLSVDDLGVIRRLRKSVGREASLFLRSMEDWLLGRGDSLFLELFPTHGSFESWQLGILDGEIARLYDDTLGALLGILPEGSRERIAVLEELCHRNSITGSDVATAIKDDGLWGTLREYLGSLSSDRVDLLLSESRKNDERDKARSMQAKIMALGERRSDLEERALSSPDAWAEFEALSLGSPTASVSSVARRYLSEGSGTLLDGAKEILKGGIGVFVQDKIRLDSIRILMASGDSDRALVAASLREAIQGNRWWRAELAGLLCEVASADDAEMLLAVVLEATYGRQRRELMKRVMQLGGRGFAFKSLRHSDPEVAVEAVGYLGARLGRSSADKLLGHEDGRVRIRAAEVLAAGLSEEQSLEFLDNYMSRSTFYYDVVVVFDEKLYRPGRHD
jgi:hypothetical protein